MEGIKKAKICLAGNPNSGKTSLFNNITGLRQHVGNYPGVTVEKKEAFITKYGYEMQVIDLPGIYGLSASSEDEIVARNVLIEEKPDLVIDVADSSNLERNLNHFLPSRAPSFSTFTSRAAGNISPSKHTLYLRQLL